MFAYCSSLSVEDNIGPGCQEEWTIPTQGVFANTYEQTEMFYGCPGTRSNGDDLPGVQGASYTYYTKNEPV